MGVLTQGFWAVPPEGIARVTHSRRHPAGGSHTDQLGLRVESGLAVEVIAPMRRPERGRCPSHQLAAERR